MYEIFVEKSNNFIYSSPETLETNIFLLNLHNCAVSGLLWPWSKHNVLLSEAPLMCLPTTNKWKKKKKTNALANQVFVYKFWVEKCYVKLVECVFCVDSYSQSHCKKTASLVSFQWAAKFEIFESTHGFHNFLCTAYGEAVLSFNWGELTRNGNSLPFNSEDVCFCDLIMIFCFGRSSTICYNPCFLVMQGWFVLSANRYFLFRLRSFVWCFSNGMSPR